ncbi:hypothetical protein ACFLVG_01935 [Chloroflexota bacterium]
MLRLLRTILDWGWCPILITALALVGYIYEWPIEAIAPILGTILVIGLVMTAVRAREKQLELSSLRLRQLTGYFNRRFMGDSTLSIFAIIDSLFNLDNPKLWDWARACDMSKRIFNTWCNSFINRLEGDTRTGRFSIYLRTYLNELWLVTNHYYEFIEQFYEIAQKVEILPQTIDQYNRFVTEYNSFVQNFQDNIVELKKVTRTEIEPPSVKLAKEVVGVKPSQASQEVEEKPSQTTQRGGYYV